MTKLKVALAALVAASTLAPAALAQVSRDGNEFRVETADLNLHSAKDADVLIQRIKTAAHKICYDPVSVLHWKQSDCEHELVSDTVARANIPSLGIAYRDLYPDEPRTAARD
ncbi:MAG: UrcA family protein [Alphaproteobacteria bacterium]|nr:UrcA family protein [Alphaproteobacteria bacterium]